MNGLSECVVTSDPLRRADAVRRGARSWYPVGVEIGLVGNGTVARTILDSMRVG